jgi:hypothetical protein
MITGGIAWLLHSFAPDGANSHRTEPVYRLPLVMMTSQLGRCLPGRTVGQQNDEPEELSRHAPERKRLACRHLRRADGA